LLRSSYDAQAQLVTEQSQKTIRYKILKRDAETNRTLYESLLQKVKEAGVAKAMRAGNVRLVEAAKAPLFPFKPRLLANAVMGLMADSSGIAFITVRERADHHIRTPETAVVCAFRNWAPPSIAAGEARCPACSPAGAGHIVGFRAGKHRADAVAEQAER
jgi:hypothetical protein